MPIAMVFEPENSWVAMLGLIAIKMEQEQRDPEPKNQSGLYHRRRRLRRFSSRQSIVGQQ